MLARAFSLVLCLFSLAAGNHKWVEVPQARESCTSCASCPHLPCWLSREATGSFASQNFDGGRGTPNKVSFSVLSILLKLATNLW